MRKFYFLNKQKKWVGPYSLIQIQFFALSGIISPETYLWHNKLAVDIGPDPLHSVYARKKAREFSFMPVWVFYDNLKIIFLNTNSALKRKLRKRTAEDRFIQTPMNLPGVLDKALSVILTTSIVAIHDFAAPGEFDVKLIYQLTGDDKKIQSATYPIRITSDNQPGIKFEITMNELPNVGGVLYKESYGLHRKLYLTNTNETIAIKKDSVFDFFTKFPFKPQVLHGRFGQANLYAVHEYKNRFNRLVLKVADDKLISPQNILKRTGAHLYDQEKFNVHASLMGISFRSGGSYTEIFIDNKRYHFYCVAESIYLIDGVDREDLSVFKHNAEIIRIALALLSGKFYGGTCNYVSSDDSGFTNIDGVWYEIERPVVLSDRRVIDLEFVRREAAVTTKKDKNRKRPAEGLFDSLLFSGLCDAIREKYNLRHVAELVISGMGNADPIQQGALYSVALEALTEELGTAKSSELKPISDKPTATKFKEALGQVLVGYTDSIPQPGMEILKKKIENINSPANQDRLTKTFELYGIALNQWDIAAIKNRNEFLHGRTPLNRHFQFDLMQISLRLHSLIVALLLKSVGYTGHIINLDVLAILNDEDKMLDLFSQQNATLIKLNDSLNAAIDIHDEEMFDAVKQQILTVLKENKVYDAIRYV